MDFDLFVRGCKMLNEKEVTKLKHCVLQCLLYETTDFAPVHMNRKATKRYLEQIKAATKLSSTINESINKLRERIKDEEKDDF